MKKLITIFLITSILACNGQEQVLGVIKSPDAFTNAVIVCDGNSLTRGYQASDPPNTSYPARLQQSYAFSGNGATVTNKGVDGQETQDMIDDAAADIDVLYNASVKSILVAWEVGNDIYYNGNATDAYNRFVEYCQDRQAAGWKVIAVTVPYREHSVCCGGVTPAGDDDATYNTKRLAANASIVANWETFADGLVDLAANSNLSSYNATYYNADKVHFNDAGYQLIANLILPVILTL